VATTRGTMSIIRRKLAEHLISINDLTKEEIDDVLEVADYFKKHPNQNILQGRILANCFYEASTRTRLSFETAMLRLGGNVIGFSEGDNTSMAKGESLADSLRVISEYGDIMVVRHPLEGAALLASQVSKIPVINGGDGANQHPTQTLLDLYTIKKIRGSLEGLHIAWMGDMKYGRAVHSLVKALIHYNARMYFISPTELELPKELCEEMKRNQVLFSFHPSLDKVIQHLDILYMTRQQKERVSHSSPYFTGGAYTIQPQDLELAKESFKILHPLPRVQEIDRSIDPLPCAHYFEQSANGVPVRQAILSLMLGEAE